MQQIIDVNGRARTFTVIATDSTSESARDLVLIFHGSMQTGETHRRFTGAAFDALRGGESAVVAYLDGYKGNWNDARKESYFPARRDNVDDVSYVAAVVDRLVETHNINPLRVHGVGYSNGGQMVIRLIHQVPDLFAGAAVISATMPSPESFLDPSSGGVVRPIPIMLIHGTADPIVPFEGGAMRAWAERVFRVGGTTWSMSRTAEYFAQRNGITAAPATQRISPPSSRRVWISQTDYRDDDSPPVRLLTVHGGGHTIPGPRRAPFVLGRTSSDVTAAQEIASFLGIGASRVN